MKLLKNIVNLHFEWAAENNAQEDVQVFTIREIEYVIECLNNGEEVFDVIMAAYGGRYRKDKKEKLKEKILKFLKFNNTSLKTKKIIENNFKYCVINKNLIDTVNSVIICLRNKRNVIILGNNESGLTQIVE